MAPRHHPRLHLQTILPGFTFSSNIYVYQCYVEERRPSASRRIDPHDFRDQAEDRAGKSWLRPRRVEKPLDLKSVKLNIDLLQKYLHRHHHHKDTKYGLESFL